MNRRPFLTSIATLSVGSLLSFKSKAENVEENANVPAPNLVWHETADFTPTLLQSLENEFIYFRWMSDATAEIKVKKSGNTWKMGPVAIQEAEEIDHGHVWIRQERSICEQFPGRFRGEKNADKIRFYLLDLQNKTVGTFCAKAVLESDWLSFEITEIDPNLPNLTFPTPIENDMLLLPMGVGRLIRKPLPSRFFHTWYAHLNMRFCAGLNKDNNGYLAVFDEGYEDSGIMAMGMSVMPVWLKSLGKWRTSRTVRYSFTSDGYVGVAKKYREWATKKGIVKTLNQKIKETPQLNKMVGGRQITSYIAIPKPVAKAQENSLQPSEKVAKTKAESMESPKIVFNYKELQEMLAEVTANWGVKKGMINIRGWIRGGYDYSHPDVWPPETKLGAVEDLKKLCTPTPNFFTVLHDNYMDVYEQNPSFPKGVIIDKRGKLMRGGNWPGGQAYIMNYKESMGYIKRNWEQIKTLQTSGMFIDTTTAVQLYETYEPGNMMTRADDAKYKIDSIKFFKAQKQVYGSEETADFGIPYVDFFETRHSRKAGESVPLWPLVFHDCVMNSRYVDPSNMVMNEKPYLEDMLWGYFILFRMGAWLNPAWKQQKEQFMASLPADDWFGKIATATMVNHEFLSDDFEVEKTTFGNGMAITVNFSKETKSINGLTYEPLSYKFS